MQQKPCNDGAHCHCGEHLYISCTTAFVQNLHPENKCVLFQTLCQYMRQSSVQWLWVWRLHTCDAMPFGGAIARLIMLCMSCEICCLGYNCPHLPIAHGHDTEIKTLEANRSLLGGLRSTLLAPATFSVSLKHFCSACTPIKASTKSYVSEDHTQPSYLSMPSKPHSFNVVGS